MVVSQPSPSPSMILTDLPAPAAEAVSRVVALFDKHVGSGEGPDDFEAAERDALSAMKDVCCLVLRSVIESRDDGAGRIERDGQVWYRVEETAKTVMTSLGAVEYRRPRYRRDGASSSIVPVDESLGLVNGCLTRTAAHLGVWLMGHCTSREAEAFFGKMGTMTPSASTLQRLVKAAHGSWETIGATALDTIRAAEGIPADAVTAAVSLDGIMVPLRAGEDGRAEACWREASCGTVSFHDSDGERLHTLYLGRMPESGKVSLKAQLRAEVAHIKACRPDIEIVALADGAPDNWSFLETLSPMAGVVDFWHACEHLSAASDHAVARNWYEKYREILRHDADGVEKVIRALRHLLSKATSGKAEIERELAFFRKNRHRMRYRTLRDRKLPIGSGVVEAANKTLITQRMKRSGMRWRIPGGQAVLSFRALIKSGRFEHAWEALVSTVTAHANDNDSANNMALAA